MNNPLDFTTKYCIIGAGSSGIAAAKNLKALGISFDVIEREDDIGGNWYYGAAASRVYKSTHMISSKPLTQYTDYPMPKEYPDFPHHRLVLAYLRDYARHFDLYPHVEFNLGVEEITPLPLPPSPNTKGRGIEVHPSERSEWGRDLGWGVTLSNGETRLYKGVIIANGHNWDAKYPLYGGTFSGETIHSAQYKTPDIFKDKRVLIIGAGNSGCDIAVEAAQNATQTYHSLRRGYHYIPKWAFGKPVDQWGEILLWLRLPILLRRLAMWAVLLVINGGTLRKYGLRSPDHKLFQTHPIINTQILYYLGHGDIVPKVDVERFEGKKVWFKDGSCVEVDLIVYATGYNLTFPFIDKKYLNWDVDHPNLYLNIFHPLYDNLFVIGLIQPASGQFGLVDYQALAVAKFIHAQAHAPAKADRLRQRKQQEKPNLSAGIRYLNSTRHLVEVEHFSYRNRLKRIIKQL